MKTLLLSDIHSNIYALEAIWQAECDSDLIIIGHTHRQAVRYLADDLLWLNPGSVSYRRRDDPEQSAHYAVIVDGVISLKRLSYDLTPLRTYVAQVALKAAEIDAATRFFAIRAVDIPAVVTD